MIMPSSLRFYLLEFFNSLFMGDQFFQIIPFSFEAVIESFAFERIFCRFFSFLKRFSGFCFLVVLVFLVQTFSRLETELCNFSVLKFLPLISLLLFRNVLSCVAKSLISVINTSNSPCPKGMHACNQKC